MSGGGGGYQYIPQIQTSNSSSSGTTTIPAWLTAASRYGVNNARNLLNGTQAYGGNLTSQLTGDQMNAGNMIRNSVGQYNPQFALAGQAIQNSMNQINPQTMQAGLQNIGSYMNPYIQNVIQAAQSAGSRALGNNLNQIRDSAIGSRAAYGSRHGVQEGAAAEQNAIDQQNFVANQLSGAYGQAAGYLNSDIMNNFQAQQQNNANALAGGQAYANNATNQRAANAADINNVLTYGGLEQQNNSQNMQAQYQEWLRQQQDPLTRQQLYNQSVSSAPHDTASTSNTSSTSVGMNPVQQTSSSPFMGALGGGMSGAIAGAQLGSMIPGVGTGVGAIGGGLLGMIGGGIR